jgi:hypothetical protein
MKKICISILLILTCFNELFAPNEGYYQRDMKQQEMASIIHLNDVLENKLKDYLQFIEYESYYKPSLEKAIHRILVIKAVALTETGLSLSDYIQLTDREKWKVAYNKKEQAAGLLQIRPIMHKHLTKRLKLCDYGINDRWEGDKSIRMFIAFQDHYNPNWNMEVASRDWNGGGGLGMKKTATLKYYKKFYSNYKKLQEEYSLN